MKRVYSLLCEDWLCVYVCYCWGSKLNPERGPKPQAPRRLCRGPTVYRGRDRRACTGQRSRTCPLGSVAERKGAGSGCLSPREAASGGGKGIGW